MVEPKTTRIVLLGKTGAGKSCLANTIFGEELFKICPGFESEPSVCNARTKTVNGRNITLIDAPGFFDTHKPEEELIQEIARCITECSPGPHAFLIVLKVERFTEQEEDIIHRMTRYFSEDVYKYTTVVFTHGHELPKGKTIKDLVKQNRFVSDFVEKCGGRCHVIDNDRWNKLLGCKYRSNKFQVEELLKSIDETVETNNGNCYSNEMLQEVKTLIQHEEKTIAETSENMSEEEIRTEAKNKVYIFFIQAAGITVGALLGALFGAAVPVVLLKRGVAGVVKAAVGVGAAGAVGAAGVVGAVRPGEAIGAGLTVAAAVEGVAATVGAGFGAYEGHQAAKAAETPWEAGRKAAEAARSKGWKIIEGAHNLASQLDNILEIKKHS